MKAAASALVFKNFINGEWVGPKSGKTHENRNPANTDEIIGEFPLSSEVDRRASRCRCPRGLRAVALGSRPEAR